GRRAYGGGGAVGDGGAARRGGSVVDDGRGRVAARPGEPDVVDDRGVRRKDAVFRRVRGGDAERLVARAGSVRRELRGLLHRAAPVRGAVAAGDVRWDGDGRCDWGTGRLGDYVRSRIQSPSPQS